MENFQEWVEKINESGIPIIVEGKKDLAALRNSGVKNLIIVLKKPLFEIIEGFVQKKVIILTDFDKKGKELYGKLNSGLQARGVVIDNIFREWLQNKTKLSHIEGIDSAFGYD